MNRNGSALDLILLISVLTGIGVMVVFTHYFLVQFTTAFNDSVPDDNARTVAVDLLLQAQTLNVNTSDWIAIIVLISYYVLLAYYNYSVGFNPVLMYFQVILFIAALFISGVMTEVFAQVINGTLAETALLFPRTTYIISNMAWYVLGGVGVSLLTAYRGGKR
jgi:hypothetical protein